MLDETAEEWIKCFPIGRRIGPDKLKKKFPALVKKYGFKELCDRTRAFTESHKATERKFIPYPMTWLNRGGLEEDLNTEITIENPHDKLQFWCDFINKMYINHQRKKHGNWSVKKVEEGKEIIDAWLKASTKSDYEKMKIIEVIIRGKTGHDGMHKGTVVTSFAHWESRL